MVFHEWTTLCLVLRFLLMKWLSEWHRSPNSVYCSRFGAEAERESVSRNAFDDITNGTLRIQRRHWHQWHRQAVMVAIGCFGQRSAIVSDRELFGPSDCGSGRPHSRRDANLLFRLFELKFSEIYSNHSSYSMPNCAETSDKNVRQCAQTYSERDSQNQTFIANTLQ